MGVVPLLLWVERRGGWRGEGLATLASPALVVLDVLILALLLRLVGLDLAQGIGLAAQR